MGGRLAHFAEKWEEIRDNKWVLSIVRNGFRIPFIKIPPLSSVLIRMSQSSSPFLKPSQQTGSGKGTESWNSRLLFPDIPCAKKEGKVSFNNRPVFIKPIHRETSIQNGNSQIGKTSDETQRLGCLIDLTDAYLHVPIHHQSRKYLRFVHEDQVYHFSALPFGMSLSPLIF